MHPAVTEEPVFQPIPAQALAVMDPKPVVVVVNRPPRSPPLLVEALLLISLLGIILSQLIYLHDQFAGFTMAPDRLLSMVEKFSVVAWYFTFRGLSELYWAGSIVSTILFGGVAGAAALMFGVASGKNGRGWMLLFASVLVWVCNFYTLRRANISAMKFEAGVLMDVDQDRLNYSWILYVVATILVLFGAVFAVSTMSIFKKKLIGKEGVLAVRILFGLSILSAGSYLIMGVFAKSVVTAKAMLAVGAVFLLAGYLVGKVLTLRAKKAGVSEEETGLLRVDTATANQ